MSLALLAWVGGGLLKLFLYFLGNEPSLGQKSPILLLPRLLRRFEAGVVSMHRIISKQQNII